MHNLADRIAARAHTARRLTAAYECRPGAYALVEVVGIAHSLTPQQMISDVEAAFHQVYLPTLVKELEVEADQLPAIDLFHGVVMMATALGGGVDYTEGEWPWARPVLGSITQVDRMTVPDLRAHPVIRHYCDQVRWLQAQTHDQVPIRVMDLQSPFTTAAQLRHYEDLLCDLSDDPRRVKLLLEIITDANLQFIEILKQLYSYPAYPGRNLPCCADDLGICIADDAALIPLSPGMYEEFCLPSLRQIARAVPGIFVHSCGDYTHQIENLLKIPNLRAVQMHTGPGEMDSLPAWRKIRGRIALYSDTNDISLGDEFGRRYWDCYEHYVLPRLLEGDATGLVLLVPPADTPEVRQANLARLQKLVEGWTAEPMPPAPSAAALPTDL